jgi:hypothetical protein
VGIFRCRGRSGLSVVAAIGSIGCARLIRATAPVSHQKRSRQSKTNANEIKQNCRKINEANRYSAAHNGLVAGRALSESTIKSIVFRPRTLPPQMRGPLNVRMPIGPVSHADSQFVSLSTKGRAIRPICTPRLPGSHTCALDFFLAGEACDFIASNRLWFGAEAWAARTKGLGSRRLGGRPERWSSGGVIRTIL